MKVRVCKVPGLKGYTRDVWAVYVNGKLVKLLPTKPEAQQFAADVMNGGDTK